jgi:hypothetical protein
MIEVFKTNVTDEVEACNLLRQIHITFQDYEANFDLEDCDKVLRVRSLSGEVDPYSIISILRKCGWHAEILPDDEPPFDNEKIFTPEMQFDHG